MNPNLIQLHKIYNDRVNSAFKIEDFCFKDQIEFIKDPADFKTAVCSRRSGKTIACAAHLIETALAHPERICLYITLSRKNAKKLIWKELLKINRTYKLGAKPDNQELSLAFENGSVIYVSGAKDASEIEKFRGLPITLCYIDESQSFRDYIEELIDDVIGPALMDYNGKLCLIGTPGPIPSGYFYKCSHNSDWSNHAWTFWDNPHIAIKSHKTHDEILERELKRRGVSINDPSIQREWFGKWTIDTDSLVFKYSRALNDYELLPQCKGQWSYILGVDIGFDDADALCIIAYNEYLKTSYLIEERVDKKQGITELSNKIADFNKRYNPDKIVMDTGGLGKKIAHELQTRFELPVVAAEKSRKFEYIELLNDALRTGKFMAKAESRFAQDAMLVEWDLDKSKGTDKLVVSDRYHSDICDAVLYAYRESLHWLSGPAPVEVKYQTPEWYNKEIEDMEQAALNSLQQSTEVDDDWL